MAKRQGRFALNTIIVNSKLETSSPRLDPQWHERHGRTIAGIAIAAAMIAVMGYLLHGCNSLGRLASAGIYTPDSTSGFISHGNELLQSLVDRGNVGKQKPCYSVDDLNKRYRGLTFALPYEENDIMEAGRATDLRLVGIDADAIDDEALRLFYVNSSMALLLKRQQQSLGERLLAISAVSKHGGIEITSIRLIPSMFRIALDSDPWRSTVLAAENGLFSRDNHCFVSYGGSVLPLRRSGLSHPVSGNYTSLALDTKRRLITMADGKELDWIALDTAYGGNDDGNDDDDDDDNGSGAPIVCLQLPGGNALFMAFDGQRLRMAKQGGDELHVNCYHSDGLVEIKSHGQASRSMDVIAMPTDGAASLHIIIDSDKMHAELTVTRDNPALTISHLAHTSQGKQRIDIPATMTDCFTQQIVRGLNSSLRNTVYDSAVIRLTIDPLLSRELEKMITSYTRSLMRQPQFKRGVDKNGRPTNEFEVSVTVMDLATGNLLAAPFYRSEDDYYADRQLPLGMKNPALIRHYIGSTFKPLLATAAALTEPSLATWTPSPADYGIAANGQHMLFNKPTAKWAGDSHWGRKPSMTQFLTVSDDVYPVALAMLAMNRGKTVVPASDPLFNAGDWNLKHDAAAATALLYNPLMQTVENLYGIKSWSAGDTITLDMAQYVWNNLHLDRDRKFALDIVSPDMVNMQFATVLQNSHTLRQTLVPWILGQGNNEWNCVKLAEAWSRMLTKRQVTASLVSGDSVAVPPLLLRPDSTRYDYAAWDAVLTALRDAQSSTASTLLSTMYQRVRRLAPNLTVFGKTGTPDNHQEYQAVNFKKGKRWLDPGLYCMALMPNDAASGILGNNPAPPRGIMVVVYINRISSREPGNDGISSSHARDFFNDTNLERLLRLTRDYLR